METIVALASSLPSPIAIIRISGNDSLKLLNEVFICKNSIKPRQINYGTLNTNLKDKVVAIYFKAPHSYTGEDMVEIHTHGSKPVIDCLINTLISKGARMAYNGEFSMRAYLNGKMDLTASEGIVGLLNAQTQAQAASAYKLINGQLKNLIDSKQKKLNYILAYINADLDYPEENVKDDYKNDLEKMIEDLKNEIFDLKQTYDEGRKIIDGVRVVVIGKVNVGKSSLINALLNKDRMIVSDIEGTTRDTVEDFYFFKGQKFILIDTAGIRQTNDKIENEGILRGEREIEKADIILSVSDNNEFKMAKNAIYVKNKCDISALDKKEIINVSALNNINIDALKLKIYEKAFDNSLQTHENIDIITDLRHFNCLDLCYNSLCEAISALKNNVDTDCICAILNDCYDYLGQITGIVGNDEMISEIFSRFCVGK